MGTAILWFLAAAMVATVPAGLALAAQGFRARYMSAGERAFSIVGGLALSAAALNVIHMFAAAFVAVVL